MAEQLLKGGIPAVRQALEEQNTRARAESRPEVTPGPLLSLAEQLLPKVNLASWKDRAAAARAAGKDVPLRESRLSIVASASTVTLDEEGTEMATALRTALDQRVTALRERWVERITSALDDGRIVEAVRASIRPPEPVARLSSELAVRLAGAAGQADKSLHPGRPVAGAPRGGRGVPRAPDGQARRPADRRRRDGVGRSAPGVGLRARTGPPHGHTHPPSTGTVRPVPARSSPGRRGG